MDMNLHPDGDWCDPRERDKQVNRLYCNLGDRPYCDPDLLAQLMGEQSRLRVILIGYPEDVNREILNLYHCGYEIDAWSPPQRIPNTTEVIAVYTKRSRRL